MTQPTEAVRSARRDRYTPTELRQIGYNLEYGNLAQVAAQFDRTPAAIQERLRREGQGLFANDGCVSAAQLSRQTGIPGEVVLKMIKDGTLGLDAHKVGRVWRIDWRGEDLTKQWDHATPGRLIKEVAAREKGRVTCINCGNRLVEANICCSKGCAKEFQGELRTKHFTGEFSHGYSFPPHLRPKFQDWLMQTDVGLLVQAKDKRGSNRLNPLATLEAKQRELFDLLKFFSGYILPTDYLNQQLYEDTLNANDHRLRYQVYRLREAMVHPADIFTNPGLGTGLGIESFKITPLELKLLRQLWQKMGVFAPNVHLTQAIYGRVDPPAMRNTRSMVYSLKGALKNGSYTIGIDNRIDDPRDRNFFALQKNK